MAECTNLNEELVDVISFEPIPANRRVTFERGDKIYCYDALYLLQYLDSPNSRGYLLPDIRIPLTLPEYEETRRVARDSYEQYYQVLGGRLLHPIFRTIEAATNYTLSLAEQQGLTIHKFALTDNLETYKILYPQGLQPDQILEERVGDPVPPPGWEYLLGHYIREIYPGEWRQVQAIEGLVDEPRNWEYVHGEIREELEEQGRVMNARITGWVQVGEYQILVQERSGYLVDESLTIPFPSVVRRLATGRTLKFIDLQTGIEHEYTYDPDLGHFYGRSLPAERQLEDYDYFITHTITYTDEEEQAYEPDDDDDDNDDEAPPLPPVLVRQDGLYAPPSPIRVQRDLRAPLERRRRQQLGANRYEDEEFKEDNSRELAREFEEMAREERDRDDNYVDDGDDDDDERWNQEQMEYVPGRPEVFGEYTAVEQYPVDRRGEWVCYPTNNPGYLGYCPEDILQELVARDYVVNQISLGPIDVEGQEVFLYEQSHIPFIKDDSDESIAIPLATLRTFASDSVNRYFNEVGQEYEYRYSIPDRQFQRRALGVEANGEWQFATDEILDDFGVEVREGVYDPEDEDSAESSVNEFSNPLQIQR